MLRTVFAALLLIPLACLPADAAQKHKLALQISDNDAAKMNAVLNVAANVSKYYSDKGEEVDIQIIAFNAGLHMSKFVAFLKDESGATAIEYGLIAAGISVVIIAAVQSVGSNLNATFTSISTALSAAN